MSDLTEKTIFDAPCILKEFQEQMKEFQEQWRNLPKLRQVGMDNLSERTDLSSAIKDDIGKPRIELTKKRVFHI